MKNLLTGALSLASTSDTGVKGNDESEEPAFGYGGRLVAFYSEAANLDPGDTDDVPDVYVKDLTTGDIRLVSTSHAGLKGNASSANPRLSASGSRVAFQSWATNLDPADTDRLSDTYVKDLPAP